MKELTEKEKWYLKGYADALQRAMYELTGDNTCSKSYDPISFGDCYIASYAFDLKNGGRRHELSEFANSGEIETLMLNQACEWIRGEFEHYIDMIKSNKQQNNKNKMKKFTTAEIKDLLNQAYRDEISFSRMVEIMNERMSEAKDIPEEPKKEMKLIQRIIVSPLMLLLLLLCYLFHAVERWVSYLRYGGEMITYDKGSRKMIQDVYELVLTQIQKK